MAPAVNAEKVWLPPEPVITVAVVMLAVLFAAASAVRHAHEVRPLEGAHEVMTIGERAERLGHLRVSRRQLMDAT